jgi:hypothetical protein
MLAHVKYKIDLKGMHNNFEAQTNKKYPSQSPTYGSKLGLNAYNASLQHNSLGENE